MSHIKKPCRYILNKESCPFGRRCKFLHQIEKDLSLEKLSVSDRVGTPESGTQAAGDTRKNSKHSPSHHDVQLAKSCGGRNDADDVGSEDQVTVRVPAKSATVKEGRDSSSDEGRKHIRDKVCHFYLQHGNCKFGEKCRFRHSERLQMKEQAAIVGDQGKLSRQNKKTQQAIEPDQHHPPPLTLASFIGSRPHVQRPRRVNQSNSASCLRDVSPLKACMFMVNNIMMCVGGIRAIPC